MVALAQEVRDSSSEAEKMMDEFRDTWRTHIVNIRWIRTSFQPYYPLNIRGKLSIIQSN